MKNKVFIFIVSLFAFISINAIVPTTHAIEEKDPIDLESETENGRDKSLIIPFQTWLVDNEEVEVLSYHACTDVTISICTISGQVLDSQTLPLASMQSVIFNIADYASGYYQVNITTPNKTEYIGTFMIE